MSKTPLENLLENIRNMKNLKLKNGLINSFNSTSPFSQYAGNQALATLFYMLAFLVLYACGIASVEVIPDLTQIKPLDISRENTIYNIPKVSDFDGKVGDTSKVDLSGIRTASGDPASFRVTPEHDTIEHSIDENKMLTLKALASGKNKVKITMIAEKAVKKVDTNGDGVKDTMNFMRTEESIDMDMRVSLDDSRENTIYGTSKIPETFTKRINKPFIIDLSVVTTASGQLATFEVMADNSKIEHSINNEKKELTLKALEAGTHTVTIKITANKFVKISDTNNNGVTDTTTYTSVTKSLKLNMKGARHILQENKILYIPTVPNEFTTTINKTFEIDLSGVTTTSGDPATLTVVDNTPEKSDIIEYSIDQNKIIIKALAIGTKAIRIKVNAPYVRKTADHNGNGVEDTIEYINTDTEEKFIDVKIISKNPNSLDFPANFPTKFDVDYSKQKGFDLPEIKDSYDKTISPTIFIVDRSIVGVQLVKAKKKIWINPLNKVGSTKITLTYISPETTDKSSVTITKEIAVTSVVTSKGKNELKINNDDTFDIKKFENHMEADEYIGEGQDNLKSFSTLPFTDQNGEWPTVTAASDNPNIIAKVQRHGVVLSKTTSATDGETATITMVIKTKESDYLTSVEKTYSFKAIVETTPVKTPKDGENYLTRPEGDTGKHQSNPPRVRLDSSYVPDTLNSYKEYTEYSDNIRLITALSGAIKYEIKREPGGNPNINLVPENGNYHKLLTNEVNPGESAGTATFQFILRTPATEIYETEGRKLTKKTILKSQTKIFTIIIQGEG